MRRAPVLALAVFAASALVSTLPACAPADPDRGPFRLLPGGPPMSLDALALADEPRPVFAAHASAALNAVALRLADVRRRLGHLGGWRAVRVHARWHALDQRRLALGATLPGLADTTPPLRWPAAREALLADLDQLARDADALWIDVARPPVATAEGFRFRFSPFR